MKFLYVSVVLGVLAGVCSGQEELDLGGLSAEGFEERAAALEDLEVWVMKDPAVRSRVLVESYLREKDPEIRVRIEGLVRLGYEGRSKGFAGIVMDTLLFIPPEGKRKGKRTLGVRVMKVQPDSPAQRAGLGAGDVILKVADKDVVGLACMEEVPAAIQNFAAGEKVALTLLRDQKVVEREVTLIESPAEEELEKLRFEQANDPKFLNFRAERRKALEEQGFQEWFQGMIEDLEKK